MNESTLLSALLLGLTGASHCMAMCGGIIGSLSMATAQDASQWPRVISYQIGRISSYALIGLAFGWMGKQGAQLSSLPILKVLSAILLILMGLYISRIWMGLSYLERAGKLLWNRISPLSRHLLPVTNNSQALLLGGLWGWLPCGLVYTALGFALATADPLNSAVYMMLFGIGTLPATLLAGAAGVTLKAWLNRRSVRIISAIIFIALGIYTLVMLIAAGGNVHHHHH